MDIQTPQDKFNYLSLFFTAINSQEFTGESPCSKAFQAFREAISAAFDAADKCTYGTMPLERFSALVETAEQKKIVFENLLGR